MVALSGPGWRLAPSLGLYVAEVDGLYPLRDRTSDGSIGDAAHASRDSDHNPYDGWVHAIDLDEDLAPGIDLDALWAYAIDQKDPRDRYLIYEGWIVKSYIDSAGHPAWKPYPYTGPNAHAHHLHRSINRIASARNDLRPWGIADAFAPPDHEEDDVKPRIVWFTKGTTAHAYQLYGSGIACHLTDAGLNLARFLGVDEVKDKLGAQWQDGVSIVDGPCRNTP